MHALNGYEFDSPAEFLTDDGLYRFPFVPLDPTGQRLGRIQWRIEPIASSAEDNFASLVGLIVSARQTADPRYADKIFRIELATARIMGRPLTNPDDYLRYIWCVEPCPTHHGQIALIAYPENHHCALIIDPHSSIGIEITFAGGAD